MNSGFIKVTGWASDACIRLNIDRIVHYVSGERNGRVVSLIETTTAVGVDSGYLVVRETPEVLDKLIDEERRSNIAEWKNFQGRFKA